MTLSTRSVDTAAERDELLAVLNRNLKDIPHISRLRWLYENHPAGSARTWFVCDHTGKAVGVASLFPKYVWMDGTLVTCGQIGDFGVDPEFRSLGPALLLQKATFEPVVKRELAFCYDCPPHEPGMATFYRLGMREDCRMRWYVRILRSEKYLQRILGRRAARIAGGAANYFLEHGRACDTCGGIDLAPQAGDFGLEFSALDKTLQSWGTIRPRRSAEDLTWRYRRNPLSDFVVLTARRCGELIAYVVFRVEKEDAYIVDLFGRELDTAGAMLLDAAAAEVRHRGIQSLRALLVENCAMVSLFRKARFLGRAPAARIVAFAAPEGAAARVLRHRPLWDFQYCDVMA